MAKEEENAANQILEGGAQEAANQQAEGSAQQAGIETPGAGEKEEEGLKSAVVAEQRRRQEAEERARQAEDNLRLVQQQIAMSQQPQEPQEPSDDEYVQFGDMRSIINTKVQQVVQAMQQQTFQSQHPDYQDVVGSGTGGTFRPSETLKEVIANDPALIGLDQQIANGNTAAIAVAYSLAKKQQELTELRAAREASQDRSRHQDIDNKTSVMSPAAAGGAGGISMQTQIPDVRSDDFDAFYQSIQDGEFDK